MVGRACAVQAASSERPRRVIAMLPQHLTPRISVASLPVALETFDVWYSGEPDVIEQHYAANPHNAKFAMWLKSPRRAFWMYQARPHVEKLCSLGVA